MKVRLSLQFRYNLLQIFYYACICSFSGFAAIFLGHLGLSSSQIGAATGGASIMTIVLSPLLSALTSKIRLSLQNYLIFCMTCASLLYGALALLTLPGHLVVLAYMIAVGFSLAAAPLLNQMSMSYLESGRSVNFGLARGLGSISYAASAVVLSSLTLKFSPLCLSLVFFGSAAGMILVLMGTPAVYAPTSNSKDTSREVLQADDQLPEAEKKAEGSLIRRYPRYIWILIGFALVFAGSSALSTYLIDLIHHHGGSDSLYGIAIFCMAASELPFMAIAPRLIRRFSAKPLIAAAGIFYFLRNAGMVLSPSLPLMIGCMMLQGASYGLLTAVMTYYVQDTLAEKDRVMGQTLIGVMTTGLGSTAGNLFGGIILDHAGMNILFLFILLLSAAGALVLVFSSVGFRARKTRHSVLHLSSQNA